MDDITRAVFIRPGGRTLSIWERMSQKNYLDALIVSSNITMVKTTKLGSTLHDHDGRGCCSLMQEAPEVHLEPLPRPEDMQFRTARNYELMKRVSETTSAIGNAHQVVSNPARLSSHATGISTISWRHRLMIRL